MMDFVPNHSYETFPIFLEAKNDVNSKYRNWFYFSEENPNEYLTFLGLSILPKLNLENAEVQNYLIKSTEKFLGYGIDAVRVDHAIGPKPEALKAIIDKIHQKFPKVPFIGEIIPIGLSANANTVLGTSKETLQKLDFLTLDALKVMDELYLQYTNILDGVLDFTFLYYVDFFVNKTAITEEKCIELLEEHFKKFENYPDFFLLKNLDSHDCDRIMFRCTNNMSLFQKAMKLLYKEYLDKRDLPVIYYGTEDFMTQEKTMEGESYGDHRCRQPMYFGKEWLTNFFGENKNKWNFL
jgi:glycosidase